MKKVLYIIGGLVVASVLYKLFEKDCGCSKSTEEDTVLQPLSSSVSAKVALNANPYTTNPAVNELRDTMIEALNMSNLSTGTDFKTTNEFFGNG